MLEQGKKNILDENGYLKKYDEYLKKVNNKPDNEYVGAELSISEWNA